MSMANASVVDRNWGADSSLVTASDYNETREQGKVSSPVAQAEESLSKPVRYRFNMSRPSEDWGQVLARFEQNDPLAVAKITDVIIGYLHHYRAYDRRSSWDDLCQDVLIALLRTIRRDGLRDPAAFIKYTGTITRNKLANFAQRKDPKGRDVPLEESALDAAVAGGSNPSGRATAPRSDVLLDLESALENLDPRCRQVVQSIYLQGYSYQETSDRLSMSLSAVKRDQIKGLKVLREHLGIER